MNNKVSIKKYDRDNKDKKENKNSKDNKVFLLVGIIILIIFLFFSYKFEVLKELYYEDPLTGKMIQDVGAKKICYIVLTALSVYTLVITSFLQEKFKNKDIKIENVFLAIMPVFCILLMLAMPMSKGHDETIHGLRIYEYAEGKFISNGQKAYLEEGVIKALDNKDCYNDIFNKDNNYNTNTKTIEWGYRIASYSPINYMPQVIGIFLSRIITTNSMLHLYVARLFNIVCCAIMLYYAIKLIPFGKNLLLILSLIPISIEGFSTLSADGMLVAVSFLWISYILNLCFKEGKTVKKKDIFILSILAIIIALSKTIYITLLPLLLIIPKEKWKSLKIKIIICGLIFLISAILDIGWYFIGIQNGSSPVGTGGLTSIVSNPIFYIEKVIYTIITRFDKYVGELFGSAIEWNENIKIHVFPYILLILTAITIVKGKEKIDFKIWQKILISLIIISCVVLIFTSMYLGWSSTRINYIEGIQGRYFMPILPLIFLLFGRKFSDDKNLTKNIAIVGLIMQMFVIMEIVFYHI